MIGPIGMWSFWKRCESNSMEVICQVKWLISPCLDKLLWKNHVGGSFMVHDYYFVTILEKLEYNSNVVWKAFGRATYKSI